MIIKSGFKDYYDHIAHIYGGGDPKIVYVRHRIKERNKNYGGDEGVFISKKEKMKGFTRIPRTDATEKYSFKYLVIAGKAYLFIKHDKDDDFKLFEPIESSALYKDLVNKERYSKIETKYSDYIGIVSDDLIEISRQLNAPVFFMAYTFNHTIQEYGLRIDGDVPILNNLGIPAIISASQIYQDIAYFLANTVNYPGLKAGAWKSSKKLG
jgi:hypothetical protein